MIILINSSLERKVEDGLEIRYKFFKVHVAGKLQALAQPLPCFVNTVN